MKNVVKISELSERTGLPERIIRLCKKLGADGFNANSTVNVPKFNDWYNANKDTHPQLSGEEVTLEDLKLQDKEMDIRLKKLKEKQLEKELIEPAEVKALLVELATAQSALLKKVFDELPPRLTGLDEPSIKVILDKALQEIFDLMKNRTEKIK